MRPKWSLLPAVVSLLGATFGAQALAQTPARPGGIVPTTTPAYSPYLNLLRPGSPTFQNYYGLVRPETEFRGAIGGLQRQEALTQDEVASGMTSGLPATGHRTTFLNTGGYFLNRGGGTQPSRGPGNLTVQGARPTSPGR
jgi:hypothetical protein